MATVRPQGIPYYSESADLFMLDQYPVPSMPMSWLSQSMDQAAVYVGEARLQSVIQAFGGAEWSSWGWPRLPTFAEMNCLAFLSVVHGSRGIYFFSYPIITANEQGRKDFTQVVARLKKILPWLSRLNDPEPVPVEMTSANRFDPSGHSGVHCARKERGDERLLLCVNTLSTYASASVTPPRNSVEQWWDYFDRSPVLAVNDRLRLDFSPYEIRALVGGKRP